MWIGILSKYFPFPHFIIPPEPAAATAWSSGDARDRSYPRSPSILFLHDASPFLPYDPVFHLPYEPDVSYEPFGV